MLRNKLFLIGILILLTGCNEHYIEPQVIHEITIIQNNTYPTPMEVAKYAKEIHYADQEIEGVFRVK